MRLNKEVWFIRFEPNFQEDKKTILYNKNTGELYEVSEIYFHFLESIKNKINFKYFLKQCYNFEDRVIEQLFEQIKDNLLSLGVILDD